MKPTDCLLASSFQGNCITRVTVKRESHQFGRIAAHCRCEQGQVAQSRVKQRVSDRQLHDTRFRKSWRHVPADERLVTDEMNEEASCLTPAVFEKGKASNCEKSKKVQAREAAEDGMVSLYMM